MGHTIAAARLCGEDNRPAEQERRQEQARQLADESSQLFDRLALRSGTRVVEIGPCRRPGPIRSSTCTRQDTPAGRILLDFVENLSQRLIDTGVTDASEIETIKDSLRRYLDDPDALVVSHLFIQAWGRKP
jgi:hypothetical protein